MNYDMKVLVNGVSDYELYHLSEIQVVELMGIETPDISDLLWNVQRFGEDTLRRYEGGQCVAYCVSIH